MTGKRQLPRWGENANADRPVVGEVVDEDRFRVTKGRRYRLHRAVGQEAVMDAEVVAAPTITCEHTDDPHGDRPSVAAHPQDRRGP